MKTAPYQQQSTAWPADGRVILAQYDETSIVVYQAYRPSIGRFAVEHQRFGGDFMLTRMSWIKPNFLWMMYRSGWGTKPGQEVVLAIRLRRSAFDEILSRAVPSTFDPDRHASREEWERLGAASDVRLQWDPDHGPRGEPLRRRAIQLGLRGETLAKYAGDWILGIEDVSPFVAEQRAIMESGKLDRLMTPVESAYPVGDAGLNSQERR